MESHQIVGLVLILVGISDPLVGLFIVGPRVPEESRKAVIISMVVGGIALISIGFAFLAGLFS